MMVRVMGEASHLPGRQLVAGTAPVYGYHVAERDSGHDCLSIEAPENTAGYRRVKDDVCPGEAERPALHQQAVTMVGDHAPPAHPAFVHRLQTVRHLLVTRPHRHAEDVKIVMRPRARRDLTEKRAQKLRGEAPAEAFLEMAV